ncbi:MAG: hypothetical protein KDD82_29455, partial [Planctomycetes bacterium]|nr:hypothetical protein [Planctomycetota bacterium]
REALLEAEALAKLGAPATAAQVLDRTLSLLTQPSSRAPLLAYRDELRERAGVLAPRPAPEAQPAPEPPPASEPRPAAEPRPVPEPALAAERQPEPVPAPPSAQSPSPKPTPPHRGGAFLVVSPAEDEPGDPELAAEVAAAIELGAEALSRMPRPDRVGEAALRAFALLRSGVPREAPAVARCFERLRVQGTNQTYDLAVAIMAYEAASLTRASGPGATRTRYRRGDMPRDDHERVAGLAQLLISGQRTQGDWGYGCQSSETQTIRLDSGPSDNSNTQFAVLGLHAAQRCGVEVPQAVWRGVLQHFTASVERRAVDELLAIEWTADRPPVLAQVGGTRVASGRSQSSAWGYRRGAGSCFNMTAAGLSSLVIAANALQDEGALGPEERALVLEVARGACDSLGRRKRPGRGLLEPTAWGAYGLYSLEKAMDVSGVRCLDGWSWWEVAARDLLAAQGSDGAWGGGVDTSFALLVLNRATLSLGETRVRGGHAARPDPLVVTLGKQRVHLRLLLHQVRTGSGSARQRSLLRRALREVPEGERPRLVSLIVPLLKEGRAAERRFAKQALKAITGETRDAQGYAAWGASYDELDRLQGGLRREQAARVLEVLRAAADGPLLRLAARVSVRACLLRAVPDLVRALSRAQDPETRAALCSALRVLSGEDPAEDLEDPAQIGRAWTAWFAEQDEAWQRRALVAEFVAGGQLADEVRPVLVAVGELVVPELLAAFAANPRALQIDGLLRELTGLAPRASPASWAEAWAGRGSGPGSGPSRD